MDHNSPESVTGMQKILEKLNNINFGLEEKPVTNTTHKTQPKNEDLSYILETFNQTAEQSVQTANEIPEIRDSVISSMPSENYSVKARLGETLSGKKRKEYYIETSNGEVKYDNIVLREAAEAISHILSKGGLNTDHRIEEILRLEESYYRNRLDAVRFKKRFENASQNDEQISADIFESRYQTARTNALIAKDQVGSLFETLKYTNR